MMTIHTGLGSIKPPSFIATLSRFPIGKSGHSLLSMIDSTAEGVIIVDVARRIVLVNQMAEHMFGYPATELLEQSLDMLLPPHAGGEQRRRMDTIIATKTGVKRIQRGLKGRHANGSLLSVDASISRIAVHGETFIALLLHEARHQRNPPEEKQRPLRSIELRRRAVSSQHANEVEKRRFSKKLYDDIGQRLSVLKLDLDWLENSLTDADESFPARVAQMQGLLDNVITMTKSMASALRPPLLDDFGLLAAVEWMAVNFQKKTAISCSVESSGTAMELGDPVESAIFRVIQEALTNIEKHAHASNATVSFRYAQDRLDVMIRDDGIGMETGSDNKPGCYGLIAMQERIFVLGGTISIENAQPHGVAIHASIPLEPVYNSEPLPDSPTAQP